MIPRRAGSLVRDRHADALDPEARTEDGDLVSYVLLGTSGTGKTQTAAEFARRALRTGAVDLLLWITTDTAESIVEAYAEAYSQLFRRGPDATRLTARSREFLAWLEPRGADGPRWLIVLDDVSQASVLRGLLPPASPRGQTVITTQDGGVAAVAGGLRRIEVGVFTEQESLDYLRASRAGDSPAGVSGSDEEFARLAARLGRLPLALSQAAAYLGHTGESVTDYLALLDDPERRLATLVHDPGSLPDQQIRPVAETWALSVAVADGLPPAGLARPMLEVASLLEPNVIPSDVLTGQPVRDHLREVAARPVDERDAALTLRLLDRFHLLRHTPGGPAEMHALTQRAVREATAGDRLDRAAVAAADGLAARWDEAGADAVRVGRLRAAGRTLVGRRIRSLWSPQGHPLIERIGWSYNEGSQYQAMAEYYSDLAAQVEQFGLGRWTRLTYKEGSGHSYGYAGSPAIAAAILTEALDDLIALVGPDDALVPEKRNNLAFWRGNVSPDQALQTLDVLWEEKKRIFGPRDPSTLNVLHHRGYWLARRGDLRTAINVLTDLLAIQIDEFGPDHEGTLTTVHDRAHHIGVAGDIVTALEDFGELYRRRSATLEPTDLLLLRTRSQIAHWAGVAGEVRGAADEYAMQEALLTQKWGPLSRHTIEAGLSHSSWRGKADGPAAAILVLERIKDRLADQSDAANHFGPRVDYALAYWRGQVVDDATA